MDADTRHQLKKNELAEALSKVVDFSDKRTIGWLVVIVVVALGYAGYKFWGWQQRTQLTNAQQALADINALDPSLGDAPMDQLRRLIADNNQPGVLALARLKLAEGLEARAEGTDQAGKLTEAEAEYNAILSLAGAPNAAKAPALYRLGMMGESKRDLEQAREMYTTLSRNPGYAGSPFVAAAEARLELLAELAVPVVFERGMNPVLIPELTPLPVTTPRKMQPVQIIDRTGAAQGTGPPPTPKPSAEEDPAPAPLVPEPEEAAVPAEEPAAEPAEAPDPEQP
jgi:predicted negative regulator of RcsB-dependent stress response